jgi:hypothetical protein
VVLGRLSSFKPKLYEGTEITNVVPEDIFPIKSVTITTAVKTEKDFKILMAEVVYTFEYTGFKSCGTVSVTFQFKDSKLEKKYGGKKFTREDVEYPAFLFTTMGRV